MAAALSSPTGCPPGHPTHVDRGARRRRQAAALVLTGGVLVGLAAVPVPAVADPVTVETALAERTNPSVQVITTEYNATVKLREFAWSRDGEALILTAGLKWARNQLSDAGFISYIFDRAQRDPTRYLKEAGKTRTKKFRAQYVGSGFIATPDGYVVTARHVVTSDASVRRTFSEAGAAAFARTDSNDLIKAFAKYDLSTGAMKNIARTVTAFDRAKVKVSLGRPKIAVRLGVESGGTRKGLNQPAEVVYRSDPALGADVAVLRIRVDGQLPTLALGSANPEPGSAVYVNGFPAAATYLKDFSKAAQLQPTLTTGSITSPKVTTGGIELPQTNANGSGGTSGAAAMNQNGEVVGIFVSIAVGEQGAVGEGYLMPLDVIKDALTRSGANLTPSQTSVVWDAALSDYHAQLYSQALPKFQQVKDLYPQHAYVSRFIAKSQAAINQGQDKTPAAAPAATPAAIPIWLGAGIGLVLLIGLGIALVVLRRQRSGPSGGDPMPAQGGGWHPDSPSAATGVSTPWGHDAQLPGATVSQAPEGVMAMTPSSATGPLAPATADLGDQTEADSDDEAPDAFPGWEPIDYVPSYPASVGSETAQD